MNFPKLSDADRVNRLTPPNGPVRMILDTDTYNEIDDQYAVVHALLSPDRLKVEALYAAPFYNNHSSGPADGMEKSYEEILRLLDRLGRSPDGFAFRGSAGYLSGPDTPQESDAARDLVQKAMSAGDDPLYVVAIGAITNVAAAILLEPEIIRRIVVVWLGGQPLHSPSAREFNLKQDLHASRLLFDCGVPFVQIPCSGVASHLTTTVPEIDAYVTGRGALASISTVPSGANIWVPRRGTVAVVIWLLGQGSGSGQNDTELLTTEPWHRYGPVGQLALCEDRIVGAAIENHGDLFLADVDAAPDVEKMAE